MPVANITAYHANTTLVHPSFKVKLVPCIHQVNHPSMSFAMFRSDGGCFNLCISHVCLPGRNSHEDVPTYVAAAVIETESQLEASSDDWSPKQLVQ